MKIKITNTGEDQKLWYYNYVGKVFDVVGELNDSVTVIDYMDGFFVKEVSKKHCVPYHDVDEVDEPLEDTTQPMSHVKENLPALFFSNMKLCTYTHLTLNQYQVEFLKELLTHHNTPKLSEMCRSEILDILND